MQPIVYTTSRFAEILEDTRKNTATVKAAVQEMLIIACYFAFKDGNTTPLNSVLDFASNSKAISVERITRWVENHARIAYVKKEQFHLNKKLKEETVVTDATSFAEVAEQLNTLNWYDSMKKEVAKEAFDLEAYLETCIKNIKKHAADSDVEATPEMFAEAQLVLKALKGRLAQQSIVELNIEQ